MILRHKVHLSEKKIPCISLRYRGFFPCAYTTLTKYLTVNSSSITLKWLILLKKWMIYVRNGSKGRNVKLLTNLLALIEAEGCFSLVRNDEFQRILKVVF